MSEYIIDIPDGVEWGVVTCRTEDGFYTRDFDSLEELNSNYINENFGDLQDTAYQKGLEEGKIQSERGCEGCEYEGKIGEHLPCDYCMNNFTNQWIAKSDKIEVGDEVKSLNDLGVEIKGLLPWVVTIIDEDDDYCQGIDKEGRVHATKKERACKTGRHFDIVSILEAMRHD